MIWYQRVYFSLDILLVFKLELIILIFKYLPLNCSMVVCKHYIRYNHSVTAISMLRNSVRLGNLNSVTKIAISVRPLFWTWVLKVMLNRNNNKRSVFQRILVYLRHQTIKSNWSLPSSQSPWYSALLVHHALTKKEQTEIIELMVFLVSHQLI